MTRDPLLTPFTLKGLTLKNRVMSTSHACGLEEGGMPGDRYQAYHEEKARGGIALSMFGGSSNVAPDSPSVFQQLYMGDDRVIPYLERFSARLHAHGAALMCQLTHLGRRGEPYADNWLPTIAPSAVRETLHRSFPKAMDRHDIERVVRAYADAARRCERGGLDGIETLASAHLIGQFLSPQSNRRTDAFGGSLANRCRFGLMVFEAIREAVSERFVVGFRFVVDEGPGGGLGFDECVEIAQRFEAAGTVDFFNAIYGRMDTELALARDNMPGMASPLAPWLEPVGRFKREVRLPVFHAARIADIATARHGIEAGHLDMVAMTRAHIADPHLVNKLAAGQTDRIRPCVGATHCMSAHRPVCLHNPATGRELSLPHDPGRSARAPRRVTVVGGGPAGLEAARICAEVGHTVTLFEAAGQPGGQVRLATQASWRRDLIGVIDWRVSELARLGVAVHCDLLAEAADVLATRPEVVIIATGGVPDLDWLPGAAHCLSAWDALAVSIMPGQRVLVWDGTGRHVAPTVAERASTAGARVTLAHLDATAAAELTYAERVVWRRRLAELDIEAHGDLRLAGVERAGNRLRATLSSELTGATLAIEADTVVVEQGTVPADALYEALRGTAGNDGVTDIDCLLAGQPQPLTARAGFELHRIGDAVASRNIAAAVLDALRLGTAL